MEVVFLTVSELKNPSTIDPGTAARLARSWDTSGVGGLTAADYAAILAADPFAVASYNPNTDTSHRFDLQAGQTFDYEPAPSGGQPVTETFSVTDQTTSMLGKSAQTSYSTTSTVDYQVGGGPAVLTLDDDIKTASTYSTTDKWSSSINSGTLRTASLSITGPAFTDHYTGPTVFQVWRDNIYGSFMFYPVQ